MLVVSLRDVNFGFWSHLGVLGKTPSYLAVKVSLRVAWEKYKNIYSVCAVSYTHLTLPTKRIV